MNIGIFISPAHPVPPDKDKILAPWVITKEQADMLVDRGHAVHLYASMESQTKAELHDFGVAPLVRKEAEFSREDFMELLAATQTEFFGKTLTSLDSAGVQILHVHTPVERFYDQIASWDRHIPIVFTFHDPIDESRWDVLGKMKALSHVYFAAISRSQFAQTPIQADFTVYNGVPLNLFTFSAEIPRDAKFLSVGRIMPQKGYDDAIAATNRVGGRLMIAGQVFAHKPESVEFYEKSIKPHIDGGTVFMEPVLARDHLVGHYQTARALLFPIKWEEPFGLVMIEAMSCGTPVIAYNMGSVPEIVVDGKTGFIVDTPDGRTGDWIIKKKGIEGLVEAIGRLGEIDRTACRKHVEEHFTVDTMVDGYEKVYGEMIRS